jgi:hypothetical protein
MRDMMVREFFAASSAINLRRWTMLFYEFL